MDEPLSVTRHRPQARDRAAARAAARDFRRAGALCHAQRRRGRAPRVEHAAAKGRVESLACGRVEDVLERLDLDELNGGRTRARFCTCEWRRGAAAARRCDSTEQLLHVPVARLGVGLPLRIRIHARDVALATERPRGSASGTCLEARILRHRRGRADQRRRATRGRRPTLAIADHARRARGARARTGPAGVRIDQERRAREHDAVLSG